MIQEDKQRQLSEMKGSVWAIWAWHSRGRRSKGGQEEQGKEGPGPAAVGDVGQRTSTGGRRLLWEPRRGRREERVDSVLGSSGE